MPTTDEDKAKSLMLSTFYEFDGEYLGKSNEELLDIGRQISVGSSYHFEDEEVSSVIAEASQALELPPLPKMIGDILRWLGPPLAIIAIAIYLWLRK